MYSVNEMRASFVNMYQVFFIIVYWYETLKFCIIGKNLVLLKKYSKLIHLFMMEHKSIIFTPELAP